MTSETASGSARGGNRTETQVAVIIPVRNELPRLPALIACLEQQRLRPTEVIVADGASDDGSREWLAEASRTRPWLRVVDNPEMVIPAALNRAIAATDADIVARMDAHADYAPDYLRHVVDFLAAHPEVAGAGGAMRTEGSGPWGKAIAAQLRQPWAMGGARHRVGGKQGPVDHVFCAAYRRRAVLAAGGWDRRFLANEDAELDHRVRSVAGEVWLVPRAESTWWTRTAPGALARQMWRYGYYRARTIHLHPETLKIRHLAPLALVTGLAGLTATRPRRGLMATLGYLAAAGGVGGASARKECASGWRGGAALATIHLSWGGGLMVGLVRHVGATPEPGFPECGIRLTPAGAEV